jgi:hypothetical protein
MPAMQHKGKILGRELPAMDEFDANAFLEDFVWGLMTSNEFVTNH